MSAKYAVAAAILASASYVQAGSQLSIKNACDHPIYIFKRQGSGATGDKITKKPGESLQDGCEGEAVNYMVLAEDTNDPCGPGSPCTQLEYSEKDMLYYDISNINGNPFAKNGMSLISDDPSCPDVQCKPGQDTCQDAYNQPDDVRTLTCSTGCTITLETCKSSEQSGGADSKPETPVDTIDTSSDEKPEEQSYQPPPPKEDQSGGEKQPQVQAYQPPPQQYGGQQKGAGEYNALKQSDSGEVYAEQEPENPTETHIVTQYKYVNEKRAAATEAPRPEKRHAHAHRHAHGGHFRA
ncbi:MAG: hypothetical protein M1831_001238 [Alyxoria varia]|nr:MAG: hypothetical protein M1831_001238 [Alyxoria varia]